jgi:hypothetical protein
MEQSVTIICGSRSSYRYLRIIVEHFTVVGVALVIVNAVGCVR